MPDGTGPTGREWGEMLNEVREIRHDLRTLKLNVDYLAELLRKNEARTQSMNTKIYTTISVTVAIVGCLGFLVSTFVSF